MNSPGDATSSSVGSGSLASGIVNGQNGPGYGLGDRFDPVVVGGIGAIDPCAQTIAGKSSHGRRHDDRRTGISI